ncbi:hypothetical protein [Clostridium kluyveri]|uniref:hypothetical protein n=1 Tax=Clostridium kluyveri TaxID=1534 RepID=UPI002247DB17|nr:hypothetical protein [Clostridium kluyveri]UZQ48790.1 hypothetical protein OP486_12445 [Clostridium kluyveri]
MAIYIFLLPIIFLLLIQGLAWIKFLPYKIKAISFIVITAMIFRYISILIMLFATNMEYLYMLKIPFFLNLIAVPIMAFTILYIFIRKNNIKFYYIFIISIVLTLMYVFIMYNCKVVLQSVKESVYTLVFLQHIYIYWTYIVFNTLIIFFIIGFVNKKSSSGLGIYLVLTAASVTVIEFILWIVGVRILAENIVGDIFWILALIYALNKVKKNAILG